MILVGRRPGWKVCWTVYPHIRSFGGPKPSLSIISIYLDTNLIKIRETRRYLSEFRVVRILNAFSFSKADDDEL